MNSNDYDCWKCYDFPQDGWFGHWYLRCYRALAWLTICRRRKNCGTWWCRRHDVWIPALDTILVFGHSTASHSYFACYDIAPPSITAPVYQKTSWRPLSWSERNRMMQSSTKKIRFRIFIGTDLQKTQKILNQFCDQNTKTIAFSPTFSQDTMYAHSNIHTPPIVTLQNDPLTQITAVTGAQAQIHSNVDNLGRFQNLSHHQNFNAPKSFLCSWTRTNWLTL